MMTLDNIIKRAFCYGYVAGTWDSEHNADKFDMNQQATLDLFKRELQIQDLADFDTYYWKVMRWDKEKGL